MWNTFDRRSGDAQLLLLQQKLDNHIDEYEKKCQEQEERWDKFIHCQEQNTRSIRELTKSTRDLITAWQAGNGAVKTLSTLGRFIKWIGGITIFGISFKWVADHISSYFV